MKWRRLRNGTRELLDKEGNVRDTYDQLSGIAHRRARLLKALGELSGALLRQVFEVVRKELGA